MKSEVIKMNENVILNQRNEWKRKREILLI